MSPILLILSLLGLLSLTKLILSALYYAYAFLLRPAKDLKADYGSWAVITGPTQGIGRAFAFELARKSLNLILVGRNHNKLNTVAANIKKKHNIDIKIVVVDFAADLSVGVKELKEVVAGVDVGVLVNNAGVLNESPEYFGEGEVEKWMEMVKVNLEALTETTRVVLRVMIERGRGAVVNIGSGSSLVVPSYPLYSVYASTKA